MPMPAGPSVFSACFHLVAIRSKASSQLTGTNSPFLSYWPFFLRSKRRGQPVLAVHDLGQEVALDAVQPAVDRRVGVALRGHHAAVLHAHHHRTAGAAEAAGRLVPAHRHVGGRPGAGVCASTTMGMPATAAVAARAWLFRKLRRSVFMGCAPCWAGCRRADWRQGCLAMVGSGGDSAWRARAVRYRGASRGSPSTSSGGGESGPEYS
jgi:hypothetical protein